jgi:hypothetical protein
MLDFLEVIGLIVLGSMVATVLFIGAVYLKSWISILENDEDKRHWRE